MISVENAKNAIASAQRKARDLSINISVVIVDQNGLIIAAERMDNALPISPRFAYAKAYTAAVLRMPTNTLAEFAQPGKPYFGVTSIFGGEFTDIPGGLPVTINKRIVGGVGVGGGEVKQDEECANVAMKVLES